MPLKTWGPSWNRLENLGPKIQTRPNILNHPNFNHPNFGSPINYLSSPQFGQATWKTLDPVIPKPTKRRNRRGRPWKSRRSVLNGVLWVLRTGAPWADLPGPIPLVSDLS